MFIYDVSLTVKQQRIGYHLHAHSAFQFAVRVEQHLIRPPVFVNERLHLVDVLRLVYAYGHNFHARFLLPVAIHLVNGFQFAVTWLAPSCEEGHHDGLSVVAERV